MNNHSAYLGIKKQNIDNDTIEIAHKFSLREQKGTGYLGYRDLPKIIKSYALGKDALDYGCGAGYSTVLLKSLGLNAIGTDISTHMLELAQNNHKDISFHKAEIGRLPFANSSFDLVLSTFVLFDIPSVEHLSNYVKEASRVLKKNGIFIALTGSEHFHKNNWLTIKNNIDANKNLRPGETYSVTLIDDNITFHDFFYTDNDYSLIFDRHNMKKLETHYPIGNHSDGINWTTEWDLAPYVVYVCSVEK
jgi:ubiquinone/menaquinone biosynthesis C-methylase UbiE